MGNYGSHMFTQAVQAEQARAGTQEKYAKVCENRQRGPLDSDARG